VLGPRQVGYLDLGGSGNETHAHLAADGRIAAAGACRSWPFDRARDTLTKYHRQADPAA
jgi:hypothetical protein